MTMNDPADRFAIDQDLRSETETVAAEIDRVRRDVLDPLLRRAFIAMVATERAYPTGCSSDVKESYGHRSGGNALLRALQELENAAVVAQMEEPKYTAPVGWLDATTVELGLRLDVPAHVAVTLERRPDLAADLD